nr:hypothetical protein [Bacilli bacterium]
MTLEQRNQILYGRMHNDILSCFDSDISLSNDRVSINTINYSALYRKSLDIRSYKGSAGANLKDFIDSVLKAEELIKVDGLAVHNYKEDLFNVDSIFVTGEIDDYFFQLVKKYFHNLEEIKFRDCVIKKECNLNIIDADLVFKDSIIEDIRSLNDFKYNIEINESKILKITPSTIKTKDLYIHNIDVKGYIDVKEMFLKCNFPDLVRLDIDSRRLDSFEDDFTYLPYSAPKLEKLWIGGKVKDLNFITCFRHLIEFNVASVENIYGVRYPAITDGREKKRLLEKYKDIYEVHKLLQPDELSKYTVDDIEYERLINLCNFFNTISYSEEDIKLYKESDYIKKIINQSNDYDVTNYYECHYNSLNAVKEYYDNKTLFRKGKYYHISLNNLCIYDVYKEFLKRNYIVLTKPFIYASNGNPIVFMNTGKPIKTMDDFVSRYGEPKPTMNSKEFEYDAVADLYLSNDEFMQEDVEVSCFDQILDEIVGYNRTDNDFLEFGDAGKNIYSKMRIYRRYEKRGSDLKLKTEKYEYLLYKLLKDNYELFDVIEKSYIYYHHQNPIWNETKAFKEKYYNNLVIDDNKVLESINKKTNGLYSKYYDYIKCFKELCTITTYNYDIYVSCEDIKKLKLS